jgi:Uma2 family endonuclease
MIKSLRRKAVRIGPEDHGRRMSLDQFDNAIVQPGYIYELGKGVVEVSNVPKLDHGKQVEEARDELVAYRLAHAGVIYYLAGGSDAKLMIGPSESERHPDLLIYLSAPPDVEDDIWSMWVPEIVIEVVSRQSSKRDYEDKAAEYLELGVDEYWIIDAAKNQMTVLIRWRGQWKRKIVKPPQKHITHLLPGFSLDLKKVFAAAK